MERLPRRLQGVILKGIKHTGGYSRVFEMSFSRRYISVASYPAAVLRKYLYLHMPTEG